MAKDYYAILGVNRNDTDADIKKAFRKLAHEHHPDKRGGSDTKFKEINEAYQVLGNAEKRRRYDQFGATSDQPGAGGFAWQDIHQGAGPFGGFGGFSQSQTFDFGDLGDVLGSMFGFGGQPGQHGSRVARGADLETRVQLTFDEAYQGTERELVITLLLPCISCGGSGNEPGSSVTTCSYCRGSGSITNTQATFLGSIRAQTICAHCRGTGKRAEKHCTTCHGSTLTKQQQAIKVKIPAGIDESRSIRLAGRGEAGPYNGPRGDLYIRVSVAPHAHFERDGYDIKSREEVPLSTLISGGTTLVDTPAGKVKLKIPAHTQSGTKFVLRDKGFERLSGRGRGNQFVTVHAQVPKKITARQKKLLSEFEENLADSVANETWF